MMIKFLIALALIAATTFTAEAVGLQVHRSFKEKLKAVKNSVKSKATSLKGAAAGKVRKAKEKMGSGAKKAKEKIQAAFKKRPPAAMTSQQQLTSNAAASPENPYDMALQGDARGQTSQSDNYEVERPLRTYQSAPNLSDHHEVEGRPTSARNTPNLTRTSRSSQVLPSVPDTSPASPTTGTYTAMGEGTRRVRTNSVKSLPIDLGDGTHFAYPISIDGTDDSQSAPNLSGHHEVERRPTSARNTPNLTYDSGSTQMRLSTTSVFEENSEKDDGGYAFPSPEPVYENFPGPQISSDDIVYDEPNPVDVAANAPGNLDVEVRLRSYPSAPTLSGHHEGGSGLTNSQSLPNLPYYSGSTQIRFSKPSVFEENSEEDDDGYDTIEAISSGDSLDDDPNPVNVVANAEPVYENFPGPQSRSPSTVSTGPSTVSTVSSSPQSRRSAGTQRGSRFVRAA